MNTPSRYLFNLADWLDANALLTRGCTDRLRRIAELVPDDELPQFLGEPLPPRPLNERVQKSEPLR